MQNRNTFDSKHDKSCSINMAVEFNEAATMSISPKTFAQASISKKKEKEKVSKVYLPIVRQLKLIFVAVGFIFVILETNKQREHMIINKIT